MENGINLKKERVKDGYPHDETGRWINRGPLFSFSPTAEQIANETAEAIASFVDTTATYDTSKEIAEAIRSGEWRKFVKEV